MALQHHIQRIYTDGACSGNPGPGGWGVVAYVDNGKVHELGGRDTRTTNNRMELKGAIAALQLLSDIQQTTPVTLYTDSQYVKNGITKWISGWKKKNWKTSTGKAVVNLDLWKQLDELQNSVTKQLPLSWEYVRAHVGNEGNERSDTIARAFSKNTTPAMHQVPDFASNQSSVPASTPAQSSAQAASLVLPVDMPKTHEVDAPKPAKARSTEKTDSPAPSSVPNDMSPDPQTSQNITSENDTESTVGKLQQLRHLVETFQLADIIAEQRYLLTTSELAELVGNTVSTVTSRGDSWIWRNWLVTRIRQDGNQILWQLERVS